MKLNCLKFCFLNFVAFCARAKIKVGLQSFASSTDISIFSKEINVFVISRNTEIDCILTFFRMGEVKRPPTSFSSVTSANVEINPPNLSGF